MGYSFSISSEAITNAVVLGYRGTEAISRPYTFQIGVRVDGEVRDPAELVHEPIVLETRGPNGTQRICGILSSATIVHVDNHGALMRLELVPTLWRASLSKHSRIFTDASIPEIIQAVLDEEGIPEVELRLVETYAKREHVGQYKESNLAFVSRLMEREGIFYFFDHEGDREKLVIADSNSAFGPSRMIPVGYLPRHEGDAEIGESFFELSMKKTALPRRVQLTDWNYLTPAVALDSERDVAETSMGAVVHHGDHVLDPDETTRRTRIRSEELAVHGTTFRGSGPVTMLLTGSTFLVDGHPRAQMNGELVATVIEHIGARIEAIDEVAWRVLKLPRDISYRATVTAIRSDVPFRAPRLTPRPRVQGLVDGTVDGAATSTYAQIDDHGRYKVRLEFDEGDPIDGSNSTWIRMLQPHGGSAEGFHFPLRKQTEVHVAFAYGDPDRPIIVGVAPNPEKPSVVTASNHTTNVIHTGGGNRVEIEDRAGSQYLDIRCPTLDSRLHLGAGTYQFEANTEGEGWWSTGGDTEVTVDGNKTEDVLVDVLETYTGNQALTVLGAVTETMLTSRSTTVIGPQTDTWTGPLIETVANPVVETYNAGLDTTVAAAVTQTYNVGETLTVTGDATEAHNSNQVTVVTGSLTHTVTGTATETFGGTTTRLVDGDKTLTVDGKMTVTAPNFEGSIASWSTLDDATKDHIENVIVEFIKLDVTICPARAAIQLLSFTMLGSSQTKNVVSLSATGASASAYGLLKESWPTVDEKAGAKAEAKGLVLVNRTFAFIH
jgi:type VI secretion system secreted protein VgrG